MINFPGPGHCNESVSIFWKVHEIHCFNHRFPDSYSSIYEPVGNLHVGKEVFYVIMHQSEESGAGKIKYFQSHPMCDEDHRKFQTMMRKWDATEITLFEKYRSFLIQQKKAKKLNITGCRSSRNQVLMFKIVSLWDKLLDEEMMFASLTLYQQTRA